MDEITVEFKDGTFWYTNRVFSVCYIGGDLIILYHGIFGGYDSKRIDDTLIKSYGVGSTENGKK